MGAIVGQKSVLAHMVCTDQFIYMTSLPNPLSTQAGLPVQTVAQWQRRRQEIAALTLSLAYGALPAAPSSTRCVPLHESHVRRFGGARLLSVRIDVEGVPAFGMRVFAPAGPGPFAVLLHGDGCWH